MGPKRKVSELKLHSIWDESLLSPILTNAIHRNKLWNHLVLSFSKEDYQHSSKSLDAVPWAQWCIPKLAAERIKKEFSLFTVKVVQRSDSARGDTTKLLIELQDGHRIETVIMRHKGHATVCVSSQIGCQMGCRFCATGTMGIIGDLTSGEILEQLIIANSITRIRNVVFMGMGEPLNNYESVKRAIQFMVDNKRFGLSARHVTVSTVGVLKNMYRLSDELPFVNLALSLHAPNQEVRESIVPSARAFNIEKLMSAVDYHIRQNLIFFTHRSGSHPNNQHINFQSLTPTKLERSTTSPIGSPTATKKTQHLNFIQSPDLMRGKSLETQSTESFSSISTSPIEEDLGLVGRSGGKRSNKVTGVMIEYILIKDVNDKDEHAHELAALLLPRKKHVLLNLIPYNPTEVAEDYHPPEEEQVNRFFNICISPPYEIHTRIRQEKGQDVAGACGQLALTNFNNNSFSYDIEDFGQRFHDNYERSPKEHILNEVLEGFEKSSFDPVDRNRNKKYLSNKSNNSDNLNHSRSPSPTGTELSCSRLTYMHGIIIPIAIVAIDVLRRFQKNY